MKRIIAALFALFFMSGFSFAQVRQDSGAFRQEGIASWYGPEFDGRPTASGEIFDSTLLTAAHPTLPFGTALTVTNKQNNRKVTVRVNDRGPFVSARIIDVSRAAAERLDMISTGTAPVLIESQGAEAPTALPRPEPLQTPARGAPAGVSAAGTPGVNIAAAIPPDAVPAAARPSLHLIQAAAPAGNRVYRLQVGSYRVPRNAVDAFERLKNAGLNPAYERNGDYFRVVLAGIRAEDMGAVTEKVEAAGFREALVREEK
jgi:rare lipoprotein A